MNKQAGRKLAGPLLVALAAFLWATDALFRVPTLSSISPAALVFAEHLIGFFLLLCWVPFRYRSDVYQFTSKQWLGVFLIGIGGSALATLFFTASFRYLNPSVVILLQKTQPVLVILLAFLFLGERPRKIFYFLSPLALAASAFLGFSTGTESWELRIQGVLSSLLAAVLWAISTVIGKHLLHEKAPPVLSFWRYFFGMVTLLTIVIFKEGNIPWDQFFLPGVGGPLIYIALIPGLAAVLAYYLGLKRTPASITTMVELLFPVSALALNGIFLQATLSLQESIAGGILLFLVTLISYLQNDDSHKTS